MWSTFRDVAGATADPWVDAVKLAKELGEREQGFRVRFHAYVSGDPSVAVEGTPFPRTLIPKTYPEESLGEILHAAAAALQLPANEIHSRNALRILFVHLARRQGWKQILPLSPFCQITPRAIHYILKKKPSPSDLAAAALCLGDVRLTMAYRAEVPKS